MNFFINMVLLLLTRVGFAQQVPEFEFQLYFEDAVGNKDTISLGYDPLATDTIDLAFGEMNILNDTWSTNDFQVRITNKMQFILYGNQGKEEFSTKKQILRNYCLTTPWEAREIFLDIKNAIYPITMSFDTLLYQNQCINGTTIQIQNPEIHIDPGNGSEPIYDFDYIFFNKNFMGGNYTLIDRDSTRDTELKYKDVDGKYIYSFLITLKDYRWSTLDSYNLAQSNLFIVPNPFSDTIEIQSDLFISNIQIIDLQGKEVPFDRNGNTINLKKCPSGIYIISFESNKLTFNYKIVKL